MRHITIAIDGPAGAGKSTIAKMVSRKLGILYVDTGAMYRAVALYCLDHNIDYKDRQTVEKNVDDILIDLLYQDANQRVILNGEDVTERIRTQEVAKGASAVGALKSVRDKLLHIQKQLGAEHSVVMDGRDIGTHVLPQATTKIFLTASVEERAKRRCQELTNKGIKNDFNWILQEIQERDENDSTREHAPLRKAEDAVEIDTTGISLEEVVKKIIDLLP